MRKGFTLVEFIVAVSIFTIVMTVAIASFITVTRLKIVVINMKNSQQKSRTAIETIARYSKEAYSLNLSDELKDSSGNSYNPQRFRTITITYGSNVNFSGTKIIKIDFSNDRTNNTNLYICDDASCSSKFYLLKDSGNSSSVLDVSKPSYFIKRGNITSDLEINLSIKTKSGSSGYFDDSITLNQIVLLEGLGHE